MEAPTAMEAEAPAEAEPKAIKDRPLKIRADGNALKKRHNTLLAQLKRQANKSPKEAQRWLRQTAEKKIDNLMEDASGQLAAMKRAAEEAPAPSKKSRTKGGKRDAGGQMGPSRTKIRNMEKLVDQLQETKALVDAAAADENKLLALTDAPQPSQPSEPSQPSQPSEPEGPSQPKEKKEKKKKSADEQLDSLLSNAGKVDMLRGRLSGVAPKEWGDVTKNFMDSVQGERATLEEAAERAEMLELVAKLNGGANERELFKEYRDGADKERAKRVIKMVRSLRRRGGRSSQPQRTAPTVPLVDEGRGRARSRSRGGVARAPPVVRTVAVGR
jgi:hypothetical protein